jgi:hypothetical protein
MLAPPDTRTYPPAKIFPVKETKFEKFEKPQEDGRRRALEQPGSAAIVIDNGELWLTCLTMGNKAEADNAQARTLSEQDGRLTLHHDLRYPRSWRNTATASLTKHSPSLVTIAMPIRPQKATFEMPLRLAPGS